MNKKLNENIERIKSLMLETEYSSTLLKKNGQNLDANMNSGPSAHAGSDWQSKNAYDIPGPIGTKVYSITSGVVKKVFDSGSSIIKVPGKKIYGTQVSIESKDGNPDIFYTHLKNVDVKKGDEIKCGQYIGEIMDFPGSSYDHVHIGAEFGNDLKSLMDYGGKLKCKKVNGETSFLDRLFDGNYLDSFKKMFSSASNMDKTSFLNKLKDIFI